MCYFIACFLFYFASLAGWHKQHISYLSHHHYIFYDPACAQIDLFPTNVRHFPLSICPIRHFLFPDYTLHCFHSDDSNTNTHARYEKSLIVKVSSCLPDMWLIDWWKQFAQLKDYQRRGRNIYNHPVPEPPKVLKPAITPRMQRVKILMPNRKNPYSLGIKVC